MENMTREQFLSWINEALYLSRFQSGHMPLYGGGMVYDHNDTHLRIVLGRKAFIVRAEDVRIEEA
jgi:hypothetical protein